jgi:hypothetical protein
MGQALPLFSEVADLVGSPRADFDEMESGPLIRSSPLAYAGGKAGTQGPGRKDPNKLLPDSRFCGKERIKRNPL